MACRFCRRGAGGEHDACEAEWRRRVDGGFCLVCGIGKPEPGRHDCRDCIESGRREFCNYPGVAECDACGP